MVDTTDGYPEASPPQAVSPGSRIVRSHSLRPKDESGHDFQRLHQMLA